MEPGVPTNEHTRNYRSCIQIDSANLIIISMKNTLHLFRIIKENESLSHKCSHQHEWAFRWGNEDNLVARNFLTSSSVAETSSGTKGKSVCILLCTPTAKSTLSSSQLLALVSYRNNVLRPVKALSPKYPKSLCSIHTWAHLVSKIPTI